MAEEFSYDVFLSHSSKDKAVVRDIAERLRKDGLRVWFDEWEIRPGDSIPAKIEEGLERSRALVLCMSKNAFGSDWAQLESGTFRFRDPLNKDRRFVPLRLDGVSIRGSLAQFLYVSWLPKDREQEYPKLLEPCRPPDEPLALETETNQDAEKLIELACGGIYSYSFSANGKRVVTSSRENSLRLWDMKRGNCIRVLEGQCGFVNSMVWSVDQRRILCGSDDHTVRLWSVRTGRCLRVFEGHMGWVLSVVWVEDGRRVLSGSRDKTLRLWDVETGGCLHVFEGHTDFVRSVAWDCNRGRALSGSDDNTVRLWDTGTGRCIRVLRGHAGSVWGVDWSKDGRRALSVSNDKTLRLWDVETGRCLRVLEGHTGFIRKVTWNASGRLALSAAQDGTARLWDLETGLCLHVLNLRSHLINSVAWSEDGRRLYAGTSMGSVSAWDLSEFAIKAELPPSPETDQVQYTNAKVLLVGDTSAGKTGLSMRLASNKWEPSDSTVGAWATQWKLPVSSGDGVEREIWLWDFGGQADQRLIHQLYMEETALAVLVFDGQKEDLFETLGQWDRDLSRASSQIFTKLLVAGRVDAGGLRVSRSEIEAFAKERGYAQILETSAKKDLCCDELKQAIINGIRWENIPWRSSPVLFKRLKEEIIHLKDAGRVLMRFKELRETLQLRLFGELGQFTDEQLRAVLSLLAGPGVVWELTFGSWVLLQPERINAYAQAVIMTMLEDKDERGCVSEECVLNGDLTYHSSMSRLEGDDERFVLLAMHQTLVEHGLCQREHTDKGAVLVFPSYYRRERPELVGHPAVLISYRFNGFLDEVYATLVVRLHHTKSFKQDKLWHYAADFRTLTERQLGVKLTRLAEGAGELEVYFDPAIDVGEKIIFSKYVHEHLLQRASDVTRLRHYVCPHCGTPAENREVAMRKLAEGKPDFVCVDCEKRIPLWDQMEELFASQEMKQRVRELQERSSIVLDNESKERALVGEVISTVSLAGQIIEEFSAKRYGLDMEIEFKDDSGRPTGRKLLLQLKSGDSHLYKRTIDGKQVFQVHHEEHADYWMAQEFPVMLVLRSSAGKIHWMDVSSYLKRVTNGGKKSVKQIIFDGERFDVLSVRRWRDKALASGH